MLLAAQGLQNKDIAEQLGVGRIQVARWRERYLAAGVSGIERDLPRGAPPVKVDVERLVEVTTQTEPEAATHWSTRKMAAQIGVSASTVMCVFRPNVTAHFGNVTGHSGHRDGPWISGHRDRPFRDRDRPFRRS